MDTVGRPGAASRSTPHGESFKATPFIHPTISSRATRDSSRSSSGCPLSKPGASSTSLSAYIDNLL
eukprot:9251206-Pyramimonas_sp.AAC.1